MRALTAARATPEPAPLDAGLDAGVGGAGGGSPDAGVDAAPGGGSSDAGTGGVGGGAIDAGVGGGTGAGGGDVLVVSTGDGGPVPLDELYTDLLAADCLAAARCGTVSSAVACFEGFWRGFGSSPPIDLWIASSVDAGRITYDPLAARACVDAAEASPCGPTVFPTSRCANAMVGRIGLGEPCRIDGDCDATAFCGGNMCPETCQPRIGLNLPATGECAVGLYDYDGTGLCEAPVSLGQSCADVAGGSHTRTCVTGAFCDPNYVCALEHAQGDPCTGGDECGPSPAYFCNVDAGRCELGARLGDACDGLRACELGLECDAGSCVALPLSPSGQCFESSECLVPTDWCLGAHTQYLIDGGAVRDAGTCQTGNLPAGSSCVLGGTEACAWTLYCGDAGVCVARLKTGDACPLYSDTCQWANDCPDPNDGGVARCVFLLCPEPPF